jgi:hypothetical protein
MVLFPSISHSTLWVDPIPRTSCRISDRISHHFQLTVGFCHPKRVPFRPLAIGAPWRPSCRPGGSSRSIEVSNARGITSFFWTKMSLWAKFHESKIEISQKSKSKVCWNCGNAGKILEPVRREILDMQQCRQKIPVETGEMRCHSRNYHSEATWTAPGILAIGSRDQAHPTSTDVLKLYAIHVVVVEYEQCLCKDVSLMATEKTSDNNVQQCVFNPQWPTARDNQSW